VPAAYLLFPLSVLAGLALSWRHWRALLPIYGLLLAQIAVSLVFYGSTRQSATAFPCALILPAYALDRLAGAAARAVRGLRGSL
jgi:uncharacterized SAM-binding protein YcdF (DUF218 family)